MYLLALTAQRHALEAGKLDLSKLKDENACPESAFSLNLMRDVWDIVEEVGGMTGEKEPNVERALELSREIASRLHVLTMAIDGDHGRASEQRSAEHALELLRSVIEALEAA